MADLFNQSLIVPSNLRYFLHRLSDNAQPSTNILRVNTLNSTSATSGGLVIVRLPMALLDLNSFACHFETDTTGILPKGIEGLISRLEVSVNGLGLLNLQQYNLLFNLMKESHMALDKATSRRQLQNECDVTQFSIYSTIGSQSFTAFNWLYIPTSTSAGTLYVNTITNTPVNIPSVDGTIAWFPLPQDLGISTGTAVVAYSGAISNPAELGATNQFETQFTFAITGSATLVNSQVTSTTPFSFAMGTAKAGNIVVNQNKYHTISDWLSFFKAQPEWIQTQMLGEVEVRITLAGPEVLGALVVPNGSGYYPATPATAVDYTLNKIFFTIRTCSFDNNFVDDMLHHKLSGGSEIEIPFDNYFNINQVQSGGSSQTRFSVNTQSLNKVISCNRPSYYASKNTSVCSIPCGFGVTGQDGFGVVSKTPYFQTTASNPSGKYYNRTATATRDGALNLWQYQVNNAFIPNVKISPWNTFYFLNEAYDQHNDYHSGIITGTPLMFLNSSYQMAIALDFMDAEIPRLVSGVDTRGAVSVAYLNQDNNEQGDRTDIFTCFTSILRVGANQQVQVVM